MSQTLNKYDSALLLEDGSLWEILKVTATESERDLRLAELIVIRANEDDLYITLPDDSTPTIGTSPSRPRKPTS